MGPLDALHERYHRTCAILGDLHMQRDRLDQRIDAVAAELRALQRAADMVPPQGKPPVAAAPEAKESTP